MVASSHLQFPVLSAGLISELKMLVEDVGVLWSPPWLRGLLLLDEVRWLAIGEEITEGRSTVGHRVLE